MPYIDEPLKDFLDPDIDCLVTCINAKVDAMDEPVAVAGILNYVVTRLLVRTLPEKRYWALALGIGTLVCCIFEFYRRFVAPYEDQAIRKNGDIKEYQS